MAALDPSVQLPPPKHRLGVARLALSPTNGIALARKDRAACHRSTAIASPIRNAVQSERLRRWPFLVLFPASPFAFAVYPKRGRQFLQRPNVRLPVEVNEP